MSKYLSERKRDLDQIASIHDSIASQADALKGAENVIYKYLTKDSDIAVVTADTILVENYSNPVQSLDWINHALWNWLKANNEFNTRVGSSVFYRYIVLPYPGFVDNWVKYNKLVECIITNLHIHLWYGVICGVVFIDVNSEDLSKFHEIFNFCTIPLYDVFFEAPGFYQSSELEKNILEGDKAEVRINEISDFVKKRKSDLIWLFYDEKNFQSDRLTGWRWDALRDFFSNLYGSPIICPACSNKTHKFELDHIAPVSKNYYQTIINLRPLCRKCNREKSDIICENPFKVSSFIPDEYDEDKLSYIYKETPPWLGLLDRPVNKSDILDRYLGLD